MRAPVVAGSFYDRSREDLEKQIRDCFLSKIGPGKLPKYGEGRRIKGVVVPHAGYIYSGGVAAWVYSKIAADGFPETFIIIGPNHTGRGAGIALTTETFNTPLGDVKVDEELAMKISREIVYRDFEAHRYEHSIEVQLPFLQYIRKDFKFVPICMSIQDYQTAREVGKIIKEEIEGKDVVILASSDLTHYESREDAERKDKLAIDAILSLNAKKLFEVVKKYSISMCGYGPVMTMLESVHGERAKLLKYSTSGEVQPMAEVVGYAGIIVE